MATVIRSNDMHGSKARKRARATTGILAGTLASMLVLWFLPTVVGHTPLLSWIVDRVAADVDGQVEVESASLGWASPVRLYGLTIVDAEDRPVIEVPEVQTDRSLAAILWNATNLGKIFLNRPALTFVVRENGSNVRDVLAKYLAKGGRSRIAVAVNVVDRRVFLEDARRERTWQIDQVGLDFNLPADRSDPWELKTSGRLSGSPHGSLRFAMRKQQADESAVINNASFLESQGGVETSGPDYFSLTTEGLPLDAVDLFIRRTVPGVGLAGRLSGTVEYRWDSKQRERRATVTANATAEDIRFLGPMLGGDHPSLARLHVSGTIAWQDGLMEFDRVTTESDIGSLSLTGMVDFRSRLWTAVRQGYEIAGQLDLARLAAIVPNTLKLQKNTQITSGRVQLAVSGRPGEEGTAWQGRLEVSNFAANKGGWPLTWQRPILVTLAAKQTAQGPIVEDLKWESGLLKMQSSGALSRLRQSLGILIN
jgi:hypothetical protein